jgi:hypothetical protein
VHGNRESGSSNLLLTQQNTILSSVVDPGCSSLLQCYRHVIGWSILSWQLVKCDYTDVAAELWDE